MRLMAVACSANFAAVNQSRPQQTTNSKQRLLMNDILTPTFFDTLVVGIILMGFFGLMATAVFAQNLARTTGSDNVKDEGN
ncbi:hypothetical protein BN8_01779 [Fibrisoma limi BUZ 3]|uniref:Uncharacterized protein n=1 Tax=Fibrisoma limi BUZ 3 TaxID=1185876 RepID=I2GFT2_9BACT|nr:hypothetical protein BN8_01779 [Fibrisoma limi BUZ 3]